MLKPEFPGRIHIIMVAGILQLRTLTGLVSQSEYLQALRCEIVGELSGSDVHNGHTDRVIDNGGSFRHGFGAGVDLAAGAADVTGLVPCGVVPSP